MCFCERVEQCRPGHFIITVRKHSMKLSEGSKEGCLHNIPLILLSKLALFYILQLKALFSFTFKLFHVHSVSAPFECWDFVVLSLHTYIYWYLSILYMKAGFWEEANLEILCRSNITGFKCNQMPVFILSNEPLALDLDLLSKVSQHALHSSWDGNMPMETLAEQIWI